MRHVAIALSALLCLGWSSRAAGEGNPPERVQRVYQTEHVNPEPPRIDGVLDDEAWNKVEWATDFVQSEPTEGQPPTYQTAFKILYDESSLYIAYRAYDSEPGKISNILARRDNFPGDWVEINIDSYHDHRTAFSFTSSVSGTRGDEFVSNDGNNWDGNWDPIWELRTHVDDQGWTAEVRIPLSQLRFADREEQTWGIQVQRRLFRKEERSLWQPKSKNDPGWVSRFGELRGIRGVHAQRQVELLPYTVGKGESFEKVSGDPFLDGRDSEVSLGLDGKVGVTSDLTLDFTVNPDFGQVEADPSEVNLTAFETFFQEKRPFFIEGRNIFEFQIAPSQAGGSFTSDNLFYSRRIGRNPHFSPDLADDEHAEVPARTSIAAATKLSGKTNRGTSIGVLESVTSEEKANIDRLGSRRDEVIEPLTNFFVGRVQQDLRKGSSRMGAMVTAVHRNIEDEALISLHRSAWAGGVDLLHQWHDKKWYVGTNVVGSRVQGNPEALLVDQTASARYFQRPDNDHESVDSTRTSLAGHAGSLRLGKVGGKHWMGETGMAWRSPGFEINDIGFLRRADEINQFTWVGYSIRNPVSIFRRLQFNGNQWLNWDFGRTLLSKQANTNFNMSFKNNWEFGAGATRAWEYVSNTALRGGPSSLWPGETSSWFWANTDGRRRVSGGFGGDFDNIDEGSGHFRNWWVDLTYRPTNALRATVSPWYQVMKKELQYVGRESYGADDRYLFGSLDQKTAGMTFRLDYTIRPNLTVQYYASPFLSAGAYYGFKRITAPRASKFEDRFHTFNSSEIAYVQADDEFNVDENADGTTDYTFGNPDFNVRDYNSNLVVRWEFQPGSLMYLVWSQARSGFVPQGDFQLRHDLDGLFDVHPHDVFLVKLSKWISL